MFTLLEVKEEMKSDVMACWELKWKEKVIRKGD
jgi:hypothetical protein